MKRERWAESRLRTAVLRGAINRWLLRLKVAEGLLWIAGIEASALIAAKKWLAALMGTGE